MKSVIDNNDIDDIYKNLNNINNNIPSSSIEMGNVIGVTES